MRKFRDDMFDALKDHWVVAGLFVFAAILFLAYTLLG